MRVVKKINNNVAIGVDGNNREVVIFGRGIGFPTMPYSLTDLSKIDRTYYNVDSKYYKLIEELDPNLIIFIGRMIDVVKSRISGNWDNNLTFIIADHISFSLQRLKQGMRVDFPYSYEIEDNFPEFNKYAKWMVNNINKKMDVFLEKGEITCLAMHLLSGYEGYKNDEGETWSQRSARILNTVIQIIEDYFNCKIDKTSIDYQRFRYHVQYYVKRKEAHEEIKGEYEELYEEMKVNYPKTYECTCRVQKYMEQEFGEPCSKDELLYLMLHIKRLN